MTKSIFKGDLFIRGTLIPPDLYSLVFNFFNDETKSLKWFEAKNPLLGEVTPVDMINAGKTEKLRTFIYFQLSENQVPRYVLKKVNINMNRARGIDVSHYKPIDIFGDLFDSGVSFVGVKATEGLGKQIDVKLRYHQLNLRQESRCKLIIYYHFARSQNPVDEASFFMDTVGVLRPNERLALDWEVLPECPGSLSPDSYNTWLVEWLNKFFGTISDRYPQTKPIIYTSQRIWRMFGNQQWPLAESVDLWAPRYSESGQEPIMPAPWVNRGWTIWQYSDGVTPLSDVPGVGKCDSNYFNGTETELATYAAGINPPNTSSTDNVVSTVRMFIKSLNEEQEAALLATMTPEQVQNYNVLKEGT